MPKLFKVFNWNAKRPSIKRSIKKSIKKSNVALSALLVASLRGVALLSMLTLSCLAQAQDAEKVTLIHSGWLLVSADLPPLDRQTIVVEGGEIVDILEGFADSRLYPDTEVSIVDLSDQFVLPGLIDTHVHLTLGGFSGDFWRLSDADITLIAARNAGITIEAGFTTVRDLGSLRAEPIVALRDATASGLIPGPRIFAAAQPISATAGHGDLRGLREDIAHLILSSGVCDGADDCRRAVRAQYKVGADTIKLHATGGGADPNGRQDSLPEMFDDEMRAVVDTAHALNLKVAAHAHGTAGIIAALNAGVDSIEHGSWLTDEVIELFLETGAYLDPTAYLQDYFLSRTAIPEAAHALRRERVSVMHPMLSRAMASGVNIAMGTDAGIMPHGDNAKEIMKYVQLGMSESQAIRSATLTAAELLDVDAEIGSIAIGKHADIIAVSADPLQNIEALSDVRFVMRAGRIYRQD